MKSLSKVILLGLLFVSGCTTHSGWVGPSPDHPANAEASETAFVPLPNPLEHTAPTVSEPDSLSAAGYVCPMHPEVGQDSPGNCPKCGMNLMPRKPANHDHGEDNQ